MHCKLKKKQFNFKHQPCCLILRYLLCDCTERLRLFKCCYFDFRWANPRYALPASLPRSTPLIVTPTVPKRHDLRRNRLVVVNTKYRYPTAVSVHAFVRIRSKCVVVKTSRSCHWQHNATTNLIQEIPLFSCRHPVAPHRMSCPCLVSFSVGHYDVLVSTPGSTFGVV